MKPIKAVVFDLGGVLVDWNPRYLYRKLIDDDASIEDFLARICTSEWHHRHDAGEGFETNAAELKREFPEHAALIDAFGARFPEMINGPIEGTAAILERLHEAGMPLYAITNWPVGFLPTELPYTFLPAFRDIAISGVEKTMKPDPKLFRILLERNDLAADSAVYIDDSKRNAEAARALGFEAIHFTSPEALERDLVRLGVL